MIFTTQELYDHLLHDIHDVYEVVKNFYGEEHVDLQGYEVGDLQAFLENQNLTPIDGKWRLDNGTINELRNMMNTCTYYIFIWWPEVTVTNEHDRSVDIQDLFAKIPLNIDGLIPEAMKGFRLNRATYSQVQWESDYMHSHIQGIPINTTSFLDPCLGSGPIIRTITTLKSSKDLDMWLLYCQELDMYVHTESIRGVPWRKLETIGNTDYHTLLTGTNYDTLVTWENARSLGLSIVHNHQEVKQVMTNFISFYLSRGNLKIAFYDGKYKCGMSFYDYLIDVSNCFIDFYNRYLTNHNLFNLDSTFRERALLKVFIKDRKIYGRRGGQSLRHMRPGSPVCRFKGRDITIKYINPTHEEQPVSTILHPTIANIIINNILKVLNYRYQNENIQLNFSGEEGTSSTRKEVLYL